MPTTSMIHETFGVVALFCTFLYASSSSTARWDGNPHFRAPKPPTLDSLSGRKNSLSSFSHGFRVRRRSRAQEFRVSSLGLIGVGV